MPSSRSTAATCWEMPDCVAFSRAAAAVNEPSSHTAIIALIWRSAISAIRNPDDFFLHILIRLRSPALVKFVSILLLRGAMKLGFFTMPIHPLDKDWRKSLRED